MTAPYIHAISSAKTMKLFFFLIICILLFPNCTHPVNRDIEVVYIDGRKDTISVTSQEIGSGEHIHLSKSCLYDDKGCGLVCGVRSFKIVK